MNQSITMALEHEVARFRSWAENYSPGRFGEWECDYPDWGRLYTAVSDFISISNIRDWNQSVIGLLIYAIARDNECEHLAELLREDVNKLEFLATEALRSEESDAKWQFCEQLSHCAELIESAESLLLAFASDDNEYVRRRAMLALGKIKSNQAEMLAERAWKTGDEHQRIAALHVLHDMQSENLGTYLSMAHADGRQSLTALADRISRGQTVD